MPLQRALDDQLRNLNKVAQLKQARLDREIPIVVVDFLLEVGDPGAGAFEALGRPHVLIVYLALQRHIVRGIAAGALKG